MIHTRGWRELEGVCVGEGNGHRGGRAGGLFCRKKQQDLMKRPAKEGKESGVTPGF